MSQKLLFLVFTIISLNFNTFAQDFEWNWGKDRAVTEKYYQAFDKSYYDDEFEKCLAPTNWLLKNTPNLNRDIYNQYIYAFKKVIKKTKDAQLKNRLKDSIFLMYDMKMQHFGDSAKNMNVKAYDAFNLYSSDKAKFEYLKGQLQKAIELNGDSIFSENISSYAYVLSELKTAKKVTEPDYIKKYEEMAGIVSRNLNAQKKDKNEKGIKEWADCQSYIEELLIFSIKVNCKVIQNHLIPRYKKDPNNLELAENIVNNITLANCQKDAFYWSLVEKIAKKKPSYKGFKILVDAYKGTPKEEPYIKKAIQYAPNNEIKAYWYFDLARKANGLKNKSLARKYYLMSARLDGKRASQAYSAIAHMYFYSKECIQKDNPCTAKAIYLAAYEMYKKAGEQSNMQAVKKYFPTPEQLHTYKMSGKKVFIGGWIQQYVTMPTLEKRK